MFTLHVAFASIAPIREICKRKSKGMGCLFIVLFHVRFYIAAATHDLALETYPVFFLVSTVCARGCHGHRRKVSYTGDMLAGDAMRALVLGGDGEKSHDWTFFIV